MILFASLSSLIISISTWAKPVIVAQTKVADQEITSVLMSDKLLGPFLLINAAQLIIWLVKVVFSREKKDLDEIKTAVKQIPLLISKMDAMDNHIKDNVPTRSEVELKVLRLIHGFKGREHEDR